MDLAMTGQPKVDILMYFVRKGLTIDDVKDSTEILKIGIPLHLPISSASGTQQPQQYQLPVNMISPDTEMVDSCLDESVTFAEDLCTLCCDRPMDCALVPCGHQLCCTNQGSQVGAAY